MFSFLVDMGGGECGFPGPCASRGLGSPEQGRRPLIASYHGRDLVSVGPLEAFLQVPSKEGVLSKALLGSQQNTTSALGNP